LRICKIEPENIVIYAKGFTLIFVDQIASIKNPSFLSKTCHRKKQAPFLSSGCGRPLVASYDKIVKKTYDSMF
jgi:hypothetical protein